MTNEVEKILEERGSKYGEFTDVAEVAKEIQESVLLRCGPLEPFKLVAIQNIAMKLSRLANGDSNHVDSWIDIAGYAQLVVNELEKRGVDNGK